MKRFEFRLAKVKDYRQRQMEAAEEKLRRLAQEKEGIVAVRERTGREYLAEEASVSSSRTLQPSDLAALAEYRGYVERQRVKLLRKIEDCDRRIQQQRTEVIEAQRRYRLLERLHERRHDEWKAEFAREIDALAEESFLARWKKPGSSGVA